MKPAVLFVCVRNAGRSRMAEAFLRRIAGGRYEAASAGTDPAPAPHAEVVRAMGEIAIPETPGRRLDPDEAAAAARVVGMGCGDACPNVAMLEWRIPDPAGLPDAEVRAIRDLVRTHVEALVAELDAGVFIEPMRPDDHTSVADIHRAGIATGDATFETEPQDAATFERTHLPGHSIVARTSDRVVGWAALAPVSTRPAYDGVAEVSVYVDPSAAGRGIGTALLRTLIARADAAGLWTLQAGIFPENAASLRLHERCGFRLVGRRERLGRSGDRWRDVLLYERRVP